MSSVQPTQLFYSLSILPPTAVTAAIICNVLPGEKDREQQIFEARGSRVYLRRIDKNEQKNRLIVTTLLEHDTFSVVRGVAAVRVPGTDIDHLVISSDSGRLGLYEYDADNNRLKEVHLETFGKSGVRRTVPGQYIAADPSGRCVMLASTEKNKLVYLFNRHPHGKIDISSPHEANTWATLTFDLCELHVGWQHPCFAVLEVDYSEIENDESGYLAQNREKVLSYYTVDLGLNHVVRTWSDSVDHTANRIFSIPGAHKDGPAHPKGGPGGVIVCAKGRVYFKHDTFSDLSISIPRRSNAIDSPDGDRIIISGCLFELSQERGFFLLLQTDDGDIFKLSVERDEDDQTDWVPRELHLRYFDTTPPASVMFMMAQGYIYVAAESGASKLYFLYDLADDTNVEPQYQFDSSTVSAEHTVAVRPTSFEPRGLKFIGEVGEIPGLHPLIKARVENILGEDGPQILGVQGTGEASLFKMIRHGSPVVEQTTWNECDLPIDNLWSLLERRGGQYTKFIIMSSRFADHTWVLDVDGDNINSLDSTAFMTNRATLLAALLGTDTYVQVHARGTVSILGDGTTKEWHAPNHRVVMCAAANDRQLLLGMRSGELFYFFMSKDGVLSGLDDHPEMNGNITAMALANTPTGQLHAKHAVVGCDDQTVRVIAMSLDEPLEVRSIQGVSAVPVSIVITEMMDPDSGTNVTVVHIGLQSGVYLRSIIDDVTGDLSQTRSRFLGTKPVRIFAAEVEGQQCVILCSSKPWIGYHHPVSKQYTVTPMVTPWLEAVTPFTSEYSTGLCGCANTELRFFQPQALGTRLVTETVALKHTPRNFARHPTEGIVYVIETEANMMTRKTEAGDTVCVRYPGQWTSCIQLLDPIHEKRALDTLYLGDNEAALCCAVVEFESRDWEPYLMVGTGLDMNNGSDHQQPSRGGGHVYTYKIHDYGRTLELVYKTKFEHPIYTLISFKGRMAMGIGNQAFVYDLGNAQILRKGRGFGTPNIIVSLDTMGNRLVCGDVSESLTYVVWNEDFNRLVPFCDDSVSRWTTSIGMLDYETTAGGDKFGNIWIERCPEDVSREADHEGVNGYIANEQSYMGGTPYRLENRAHYFCQDIPMSVQRASLVPGGEDVLFWSGIQGTLGLFIPFVGRRDALFFTQLELHMRQKDPPLTGRDHLSYRSYYSPVRAVIDGDLCERFLQLPYDKKQRIAADCNRDIQEIEKKVQDMRSRVSF